jgi:hypothetical protein
MNVLKDLKQGLEDVMNFVTDLSLRLNGCMDAWMHGWMHAACMRRWMDALMDGWTDGCMDAWMKGCMDA